MSVTLESFDMLDARTYYGNASIDDAPPSVADSAGALREYAASGKIQELLNQHGAVLTRAFGHPSAETLADLVGAAEQARGYHPYEKIGLTGRGNEVANNVWTANEGSLWSVSTNIKRRELLPHD
ncbi:unnamed protein product [Clonostachys chloroleuca]|uniref:Uncharacterized protein n=1 Tax=Clonostachys chloroleuca TaxID=1926264 RepID=A0AA35MAS9_9HYPO|nr:unnamed protein product [Clonostachys chloroleuca]